MKKKLSLTELKVSSFITFGQYIKGGTRAHYMDDRDDGPGQIISNVEYSCLTIEEQCGEKSIDDPGTDAQDSAYTCTYGYTCYDM